MIKGLTDTLVLRRDGKIRAGFKEEGDRGALKNTPFFLLHDSPQLIPVLGENPAEIYFTVYSDDLRAVARDDLRLYSKTELICLGNGETAAYFANGEVAGVRQKQHPLFNKSRERACMYKQCPEYMNGQCSEHIFLDMVIPQYSMASVFTLDNTSINGLLNILSALQKAQLKYAGKLSGQIFRLFKQDMELNYQDPRSGRRGKAPRPVVHMESVSFQEYEAKFRDKVKPEDWEALMALRGRPSMAQVSLSLEAPQETQQLTHQSVGQLPAPEVSDEEVIRARANDPLVLPLFEELAALRGKPNTEEARFNTAKMVPSVQTLVEWLKRAIAADKKKQAAKVEEKAPQTQEQEAATPVPPPTAAAQAKEPPAQSLF